MNGAFQKLLQRLEADDDDSLDFLIAIREPATSIRGCKLLNTTLTEVAQRDQERARAAIEKDRERIGRMMASENWKIPPGLVCSARLP